MYGSSLEGLLKCEYLIRDHKWRDGVRGLDGWVPAASKRDGGRF